MKRKCDKCNSVFTLTHHRQVICPDCRACCIECGKELSHGSKGNICMACLKLDDTGHERAALQRMAARQAREIKPLQSAGFRVHSLMATADCPTPANAENRENCLTGAAGARRYNSAGIPSYE